MNNKSLRTTILAALLGAGMQVSHAGTATPPIMGWSSWNTYHVNISDSLIMRQADAMKSSGLSGCGYKYVNIDDGFFGYRDKTGRMHPHPERFPKGVKVVADYIHSLGLKAGIYSDAGSNTCGSRYDNDPNGFGAGMYGHEYQDAELYFKEWGFDFIKIDYCGAGTELNLEERKRYTEIKHAIDSTGRKDVSLNICRWTFPGTWARDIATSWRISSDIRPRWSSVKNIIELNMPLSAYCRDGHYNDMDMLEMGRGLKQNEEEVHFAMWCMMSSPLLIGCDMTKIKPATLELLKNKELIALNQDALTLQAYPVQHEGETYVLVKDILQERGTTRAVALYNASDSAAHFSVPLSALELGGKVKLRDLVRRKNLKPVKDSIVTTLPARSVLVMKAEAQKRLEPEVYEAEWGYLPCFDNLGKDKRQVMYANQPGASMGMTVAYLGGRRENIIRWDRVYSDRGGDYDMTVTYMPDALRGLQVSVNGKTITVEGIKSEKATAPATVTVPVHLDKGYNVIEMGNPYAWAVDIDKFELKRK